jgi:hypothetical protein
MRVLSALIAVLTLFLTLPAVAGAFSAAGAASPHSQITRAALACPAGVPSDGSCFEPRSINQLAGSGTLIGAVEAPAVDEGFSAAAHCYDGDFLATSAGETPYPKTRAEADEKLLHCRTYVLNHLKLGRVEAAQMLLAGTGELDRVGTSLAVNCVFLPAFAGRTKCNALGEFGRALSAAQDFYAHSNWTDEAAPGRSSIDNPPGLNRTDLAPLLDSTRSQAAPIPVDLVTACTGLCLGRIGERALSKDHGKIDPVTGAAGDPGTPRGAVGQNFQKAVHAAIAETRRQWRDFREALVAKHGVARAGLMVCALTRDRPFNECVPVRAPSQPSPSAPQAPAPVPPSGSRDRGADQSAPSTHPTPPAAPADPTPQAAAARPGERGATPKPVRMQVRGNRVLVSIRCIGPAGMRCAGRATVTVTRQSRQRRADVIAAGRFDIRAGTRKPINLRITPAVRRLLRRSAPRVTVTLRDNVTTKNTAATWKVL